MIQDEIDAPLQRPEHDVSAQLQAIAGELWSILTTRQAALGDGREPVEPGFGRTALLAAVEAEYESRRRRDVLFGEALFGEPAWDMLVYLFAAHLRGDLVPTSSLARASAVPTTTALRWIAQLDRAGLIQRCTIKQDGRIKVLRLTSRAVERLERHFAQRGAGAVVAELVPTPRQPMRSHG